MIIKAQRKGKDDSAGKEVKKGAWGSTHSRIENTIFQEAQGKTGEKIKRHIHKLKIRFFRSWTQALPWPRRYVVDQEEGGHFLHVVEEEKSTFFFK